jgi:hypothetical protein
LIDSVSRVECLSRVSQLRGFQKILDFLRPSSGFCPLDLPGN